MRKFVAALSSFIAVGLLITGTSFAETKNIQKSDFKVNYIKQIMKLSMPSYTIDGIAYASIRDIGNILSKNVIWDNDTKSIDLKGSDSLFTPWKEKIGIEFSENPEIIKTDFPIRINGTQFSSDKPVYIINNRVYVPLIDISHSMGCETWWNRTSKLFEIRHLGYECINSKNYILSVFTLGCSNTGNKLHSLESGNMLITACISIINKSDNKRTVKIQDDFKVQYSNGEIKPIQPNGNGQEDSTLEMEPSKDKKVNIYFEAPVADRKPTLIFKSGEDEGKITFDLTPEPM